jgi:hypothetical protein
MSQFSNELKACIREAGVQLLKSHLTVSTWGNISICDREAGLIYISPSGMDYCSLTINDIVVMDMKDNVVEGIRRPSIEHELHREMYLARPEINAIIHTHPIYSTVFSTMGEGIPVNIHDEAAQALGDNVVCAEYQLPGTPDLAHAAVKAIGKKSSACLLRNHGAVCVGKDLPTAFKVATVLEMVSEIYYRIRATGGTYVPLSDENIRLTQNEVLKRYGQY